MKSSYFLTILSLFCIISCSNYRTKNNIEKIISEQNTDTSTNITKVAFLFLDFENNMCPFAYFTLDGEFYQANCFGYEEIQLKQGGKYIFTFDPIVVKDTSEKDESKFRIIDITDKRNNYFLVKYQYDSK